MKNEFKADLLQGINELARGKAGIPLCGNAFADCLEVYLRRFLKEETFNRLKDELNAHFQSPKQTAWHPYSLILRLHLVLLVETIAEGLRQTKYQQPGCFGQDSWR